MKKHNASPIQFKQPKKYKIIYADPPWSYKRAGRGGAAKHYDTMLLRDIKELPVDALADTNCALFLWATSPLIPEALQVMESWGFRFVNVAFTWVKLNKDGTPFMGMGSYTRQNAEICFLGIKGKLDVKEHDVNSVILSYRQRHSQKPDEARDRILQLCGDLPRIELFSREAPEGWDTWGNQCAQCISMDRGKLESLRLRIDKQIEAATHGRLRNRMHGILGL